MHDYTFDTNERRRWTIALLILSILSSHSVYVLIQGNGLQLPWYIETPTPLGLFLAVYWIFTKWIWRCRPLHKLGLVNIPDLNGVWRGSVCSSYDGHETEKPVIITIQQRWDKIRVELISDNSISYSEIAAVTRESPTDSFLHYCYKNEPKSSSKNTMHMHRGTTRLHVKDNRLEGEYYTGRDRSTHGALRLTRDQ